MPTQETFIRHPSGQLCWVYDRVCARSGDVRFSRSVAVLATHCQLTKRRFAESAVAIKDRLWPPTVAGNASWQNWAAEAIVGVLIARRQSPGIEV